MDAVRWEKAQRIFEEVADLEPAARVQKVNDLCSEDAALASEVLELLSEEERDQGLFNTSIDQLVAAVLHPDELQSLEERQIGPYRILRLLGEGGMGIVYLGERTDIGGLVAIKFLRDAWLSPLRRRRFEMEQQTLVRLNHASIARIYDAGSTGQGTPWFVMEYVEGESFTEYLRSRRISIPDMLGLFLNVCDAVQFAHGLAVIHRDLKPSNIFVTNTGKIKLLDFGIAKQLDSASAGADVTGKDQRLLTPAYAAPELRTGSNIGVFSDAYSLGVILYESLTGQLPDRGSNWELHPPEKPSVVAHRNPSSSNVTKTEWSDLDLICLKALQIDPKQRYSSVGALIRDISAFLDGKPVEAKSNSLTYTAGKFFRRNRASVICVIAAMLLLAIGTVAFTVRLAKARDAALAEAARTARIQAFTEQLFVGGDSASGPSKEIDISQLLERGRNEVRGLEGDPAMQADIYQVLGNVYYETGRLQDADELLTKAAEEQRQTYGTKDPKYLDTQVSLALVRKEQGHLSDAEVMLRQALRVEQASLPTHSPLLERTMWALGYILFNLGSDGEAKAYFEAARNEGMSRHTPSLQLAQELAELSYSNLLYCNFTDAESEARQSLEIRQRLLGTKDPLVAHSIQRLGDVQFAQSKYNDAEMSYRQVLALATAWYGPNNPLSALALNAIAEVYAETNPKGLWQERDQLLREALRVDEDPSGYSFHAYMTTLILLIELNGERSDSALPLKQRRREAEESELYRTKVLNHLPKDDPLMRAKSLDWLGRAYAMHNPSIAHSYYAQALALVTSMTPKADAPAAHIRVRMGENLLRLNRARDARDVCHTAVDWLRTQEVGDHSTGYLRRGLSCLAASESELGHLSDASRYRTELAPLSVGLPGNLYQ